MTLKTKLAVAVGAGLALAGTGAALAGGGNSGHAAAPSRGTTFEAALRGGPPGPFGPLGLRGPAHRDLAGGLRAAADYLGISVDTLLGDLRSGKTLADEAKAHDTSVDGLVQTLVAAARSKLDDAVKAGRLTQAQEDAIASRLEQGIYRLVDGLRLPRPFAPLGPGHALGLRGDLQAAADYLGVPVATLVRDLVSGQTLAAVANGTSGKSAAGLIAALVAHERAELADAVKAGRLTQAQADTIAKGLQQRVADRVDGVRPTLPRLRGGMAPGWPPFGHDGPHGPDDGGTNA
jgi:hypothetical protein